MTIPNPYFKNVPGIGDLKMEQIIVDYDYPLLSVLRDNSGNRYLCMCFDTHGAQQWLITPISNKVLISLLKNKATLSFPFEDLSTKKFKAVMDYHTREETFQLLDACQIPKEDLPEEGEYLDAEPDEWEEYIRTLSFVGKKATKSCYMTYYRGCRYGKSRVRWDDIYQSTEKVGWYASCAVR